MAFTYVQPIERETEGPLSFLEYGQPVNGLPPVSQWGVPLPNPFDPSYNNPFTSLPPPNPFTESTAPPAPLPTYSPSFGGVATPYDPTGIYQQYMDTASMLQQDQDLQNALPGGGGGSGYTAAQRDLQRLFAEQGLALDIEGIKRQYQPSIAAQQREIERAQERMGEDLTIYSKLMSEVPRIYARTGAITDRNYEKAKKALAAQNAKARAEVDAGFASSTGRVRAMVLSVSRDSPEKVEALTEGLDQISAYIDRGLASDEQGWANVQAAAHELAEASLVAASTATVGEHARNREQTRIQYENAIEDMMSEKRRLVQARDLAIKQTQEEAAFAMQKLEAEWALQDAYSGGGGGRGGSSAQAVQRIVGDLSLYTLDGMRQGMVSQYLMGTGAPEGDRNMLANIMLDAGRLRIDNLASFREYAAAHQEDDPALAAELAFLTGNPAYENVLQNGIDVSYGVDDLYAQEVSNPNSIYGITLAATSFVSSYPMTTGQQVGIVEDIINAERPSVQLEAYRQFGGPIAYAEQLQNLDLSALQRAPAYTGFSSPLGASSSAAQEYHGTGR